VFSVGYDQRLSVWAADIDPLSMERGGGDMAATTSGITLTWLASKVCCVTDVAGLAVANVADREWVVTGRKDGVLGISSEGESSTNPTAMWRSLYLGLFK